MLLFLEKNLIKKTFEVVNYQKYKNNRTNIKFIILMGKNTLEKLL